MKTLDADEEGVLFDCGEGTVLYIYKSVSTKAEQTVAGFMVSDIEAEMHDLKKKGIIFEEYDLPDLKTVNGIATGTGGEKTARFKDTEGEHSRPAPEDTLLITFFSARFRKSPGPASPGSPG